jgi:hypothetical protein
VQLAGLPQEYGRVRQDSIRKDKADRWRLRGRRDQFDNKAIVDEAEEDDTGLNRVEERRVLCVFRWWFVVTRLRWEWHMGF